MADIDTESRAREMMANRSQGPGMGGMVVKMIAMVAIVGVTIAAVFAFTQDDKKKGNEPVKTTSPGKGEAKKDAASGDGKKGETPADKPLVEYATAKIAGKEFKLEVSMTNEKRFHGLSGRTEIPGDGGMLFVFTDSGVGVQNFVMRDCPIGIDIIYLDSAARVTAFYKMKAEPPRNEAEKNNSPPLDRAGKPHPEAAAWMWTNDAYEARLKKYSSKFASQYVIELKGDTLDTLKIKEGDKVELVGTTWDALKKQAQ